MAFPIMIVFISKIAEYLKDKSKLKSLFVIFCIFGIVSLPIGLWYQVRNRILFNQSFGYILRQASVIRESAFERTLLIPKDEFLSTYCSPLEDHNIILYIIKSSVFGEYTFDNVNIVLAHLLRFINFILIGISIFAVFFDHGMNKSRRNPIVDWIVLSVWIFHIYSYFLFCFNYPSTCSMDFRYIVPTIFCGIYYIAKLLNYLLRIKKTRFISYGIISIVIVFCVLSSIMILQI